MLGVPGEARLLGHGVSTCATCDGFFFKEKDIVVVGGGDSAIEEALFLTRFGDTCHLVHRRKELRASKIMQDRAFANERISFRWNSVVEEVLGDSKVTAVRVRDVVDRRDEDVSCVGRLRRDRPQPEHRRVRRPARARRERLRPHDSDGGRPRRTSTGSSRAATSRTTTTGRQ